MVRIKNKKYLPTLINTRHENKYEGNGRPNSFLDLDMYQQIILFCQMK